MYDFIFKKLCFSLQLAVCCTLLVPRSGEKICIHVQWSIPRLGLLKIERRGRRCCINCHPRYLLRLSGCITTVIVRLQASNVIRTDGRPARLKLAVRPQKYPAVNYIICL